MSDRDERACRAPAGEEIQRAGRFTIDASHAGVWQYSGWIEVEVYPSKLLVRWEGEDTWSGIEWWELMRFADLSTPRLRDELQWERERAYSEGLEPLQQEMAKRERADSERLERLRQEMAEREEKAYARGLRDAKVVPIGRGKVTQ